MGILRFSTRVLLFYGILLGVFGTGLVHQIFGRLVGGAAAEVLELSSGQAIRSAVNHPKFWSFREGQIAVFLSPNGPGAWFVSLDQTRNVPLFVAVVLAGSRFWRRRQAMVLAAGVPLLILLDGAVLAASAWTELPEETERSMAFQVLSVLSVYSATGAAGLFAAPVFVGALAAISSLADTPAPRPVQSRNSFCGCGSKLRFKRCCGAPKPRQLR